MRLARETAIQDHLEDNADLDDLFSRVDDDDKTFAAMGISKTISTVGSFFIFCQIYVDDEVIQIISSIDSSEILTQIQEIIIPIVIFTFENRLLGML